MSKSVQITIPKCPKPWHPFRVPLDKGRTLDGRNGGGGTNNHPDTDHDAGGGGVAGSPTRSMGEAVAVSLAARFAYRVPRLCRYYQRAQRYWVVTECEQSAYSDRMAPVMRHRDSRARAAEAYDMHLDGYSWQDIADKLGFRGRSGAQTAVNRHLAATTPDPSHIARRKWIDAKRRLRARVSRQLALAEQAEDADAVAALSKAVDRIDDQLAKAQGYYAPTNVNVAVGVTPSAASAEWLRQAGRG